MCHCQSGDRSRLGKLRESVFPLGVSQFVLYPQPGAENLGVFSKAFHSEFPILRYTHNLELKTSEFSPRHIDQTRRFQTLSFPFRAVPKTENSELKTLEFYLRHIYQIPRFSDSEFSISHYTQNGKLGVENFGFFSKVYPNNDFVHCRGGLFDITGLLMSSNFLRPPNNQTNFFKDPK